MNLLLLAMLATTVSAVEPVPPPVFEAGCNALIYPCTGWPIDTLPEAPAEVFRLPGLPDVAATASQEQGGNVLVRGAHNLLSDDVLSYAVTFDGYFRTTGEGAYGFTVVSDDPFQLWIEGQEIPGLASEFTVDVNANQTPRSITASGSALLAADRWYRISIQCRQRRLNAQSTALSIQRSYARTDLVRGGAVFRCLVNGPDGQTAPLALFLPKPVR